VLEPILSMNSLQAIAEAPPEAKVTHLQG